MLLEFKFSNYRSFRNEATLCMEAAGLSDFKQSLLSFKKTKYIPAAAIYGKNGGGKSNTIRAFWLAVQFIRNAQRTQHESANIPVNPFALDDTAGEDPTAFEFTYVLQNIKYTYGFSATKTQVYTEYLYHAPKGQRSTIFTREGQVFAFPDGADKRKKEMIAEAVAPNQLFFALACVMNHKPCINAMRWFREYIYFSRDFTDIPKQLLSYAENPNMLHSIVSYAKNADLGIADMSFEFNNVEVSAQPHLPEELPEDVKNAFAELFQKLASSPNVTAAAGTASELKVTSMHTGISSNGETKLFPLELADESDGTHKLMALAPAIENALALGGLLLVDELERTMHPAMVDYIVSKFQSPNSNPNAAQIVFTTHNTELLNLELLRKDQLYFVDKDRATGISELYSMSDFSTRTSENIRKGYLIGKYGATPEIEIEEVE